MRHIQLKDQDGDAFYEKLHFKFIQMPFFNKEENELETHFDKWIYFLKKLETFNDIPNILREPIFEKAFKTAAMSNMSLEELEQYEKSRASYNEVREVAETAWMEGKEEGLEEGQRRKAIAIAKEMKEQGEPIARIKLTPA